MYLLTHVTILTCLSTFLVTAFQITGAQLDLNISQLHGVPQRREINSFATSGPEFDLYILALQRFQLRDQSHQLSYFQIAGIHGFPKQAWDGVSGNGTYPGFCTHGTVVFPTWHRAYLALFEQMIWTNALYIAELYPAAERERYRAAAKKVRIPYWDWVLYPELPPTTTRPTLLVNTPDGFRSTANPLYEYRFHAGPQGNNFPAEHPLANLNMTTRYYNHATGKRNDSAATEVLVANAANTLVMTYRLLSSVNNYTSMSCTSPGGTTNRVVNLEGIHNNIHNFVGGFYGHMFWPELSAFDPIFWLHHGNVDRIFALWQAINPTAYITPTTNRYGSFAELPGTTDSGTSGLAPFHADNGSAFWTSDGVRTTMAFSYTYPELASYNISMSNFAAHVRSQVNSLYAPPSNTARKSTGPRTKRAVSALFSRVSIDRARQLGINNASTQWSISVQIDQECLLTPLNIDFFMGQPPVPAERATAQNLVGSFAPFLTDRKYAPVMNMHPTRLISGEVSLTHVLLEAVSHGIICDLTPASVVPLLQKQLTWAARTQVDRDVDTDRLVNFSVLIHSQRVQSRVSDHDFPIYGPVMSHPEVTQTMGARFCKSQIHVDET